MGNEQIMLAEGVLATCIQHEIDHLEGILFIDHLSNLKKNMIVKKLIKSKKSSNKERIVA
jgi:peptide deformylase